ncbi:MAG: DEAD/DEAH box helicase [Gudongella sp.]|nr:DEAD/DEAH box helicase [Gudongella sp.]
MMDGDNDRFDPIESSENIIASYRRYIHSVFETDDPEYNRLLDEAIAGESIGKGPILEISKRYERSSSVQSLIDDETLSKDFAKILPVDASKFILYRHQEDAIRKLSVPDSAGRYHSAVITTGTGSGKTESFLFPIINELMREKEQGKLRKTVHALLLYPMNALANDQIDRIRDYLRDYSDITFGCFTGDTEQTREDALKKYQNVHYRIDSDTGIKNPVEPLANEKICRDEMTKDEPPNILITNYAMLERLLILPKNENLFGTADDNDWKFVVIDEAHTYNGAKGSEFAVLLRRVASRVNKHNLRFILTSATIGEDGEEDKVAEFAQKLCNVPFDAEDVIKSTPFRIEDPPSMTPLGPEFYRKIAKCLRENHNDLDNACEEPLDTFMGGELAEIEETYGETVTDPRDSLYSMISRDDIYFKIRDQLEDCPLDVEELSRKSGIPVEDITDFIACSSMASIKSGKDRVKLFDAKYHMFLRGFNGVYITLAPNKNLSFATSDNRTVNGEKMHVFQISTCYNCGAIYLLGKRKEGIFVQPKSAGDDITDSHPFLLCNQEEIAELDPTNNKDLFYVCARCGSVGSFPDSRPSCGCGEEYLKVIRQANDKEGKNCSCFRCNQRNNIRGVLRSLYLGQRAVTSVLMTSLFGELCKSQDSRILAFSDSRRAAGEFPIIVEESHHNLLMHRMIFEIVRKNEKLRSEGISFEQFRLQLESLLKNELGFDDDKAERESWEYLVRELCSLNSKKSLEYNNMILFEISPDIKLPKLNTLSEEETRELYNVLVKNILDRNAVVCKSDFGYDGLDYRSNIGMKSVPGKTDAYPTKKVKQYIENVLSRDSTDIKEVNREIHVTERILVTDKKGRCVDVKNISVTVPHGHYHCTNCQKNYPFGVKNRCILCGEEALEWIPQEVFEGDSNKIALDLSDHYVCQYATMPMRDIRIKEHSGQIRREDGYKIQSDFREKCIDAISCSTTFEMGVDIGDLNTVFMRNMPPSPANYIQRAGRVGRSVNSFAYILTFCKSQAHDSYFFRDPELMIRGTVPVPTIEVDNPRIIQRHINAIAFSHYWADNGVTKKVQDISDNFANIKDYMLNPKKDLIDELKDVVPAHMQGDGDTQFDLDGLSWTDDMFDDKNGRLVNAIADYDGQISYLKEKFPDIDGYRRDLNVENIEFLSNNLIIPKYAFPVDSVRLMPRITEGYNDEFNLNRDLSMAVTEYAPGAQLIVGKKLVTSRYVKKPFGIELNTWNFGVCKTCSKITIRLESDSDNPDEGITCDCGDKLFMQQMLIPKYGFVYDSAKPVKNALTSIPIRYYSSEVSFSGSLTETRLTHTIAVNGTEIIAQHMVNGRLASINRQKFKVCLTCGYACPVSECLPEEHKTPWNRNCEKSRVISRYLGHDFRTDIAVIKLNVPGMSKETAFSTMYALIDGLSVGFGINRMEIGGCLVDMDESYAFVIFDRTPGGVGYVRHLTNAADFQKAVDSIFPTLEKCDCGDAEGHGSCYKCLRAFDNQFYHDGLDRKLAINMLSPFRSL